MATSGQLDWLRHILELANAATRVREVDDPGAVIAAALVVAAALDDPGVLEGDPREMAELLATTRASVQESGESPEGTPGQALLLVVLALAWQGKLGDPELFVSRVADLLDRWDV